MVVLIDTNVILDVLQKREPFFEASREVLRHCAKGGVAGHIAPHSISNVFFILRKQFTAEKRRRLLLGITDFLTVAGLTHESVREALRKEGFKDLEDCLQDECASLAGADYIVTRDTDGFRTSKVPAVLPEELLELLKEDDT